MKEVLIDLCTDSNAFDENYNTGPVLYETSDIEEEQPPSPVNVKHEDIVESSLNTVNDVKIVYENHVIESNVSDFSGRIGSLPSLKGSYIVETRKQKLARIKRELLELRNTSIEGELESDEIAELKILEDLLEESSRELNQRISKFSDLLTSGNKQLDEIQLPNIKISSSQMKKISSLESRITSLENRIGKVSGTSLCRSVNDLHRKLNVLSMDENRLNSFKEKLEEISKSYEQSILGRRAKNDISLRTNVENEIESTDEKIKKLYMNYGLLKKYSEALPQLTKRIESLQFLHSSVNETSNIVHDVNNHFSTLDSQIEKWSALLNSVEDMITKRDRKIENIEKSWSMQFAELDRKLKSFE